MIIAGFPCIGKTTLDKEFHNVLDLSSTKYHYILNEQDIGEHLKGNEDKLILNPNWPQNYIDAILKAKDKYDIVFILARDYILDALNKLKVDYIVAIPEDNLKSAYINRSKMRGNDEHFIKIFDEHYDNWRNMMLSQPVKKIYLKQGEYIKDTLLRLNMLK